MTKQQSCKLWRKLWREQRAMFEARRKFGEEEKRIEELRNARKNGHEYNRYLVDTERTVEENKRLVRLQLYFMKMQRGLIRHA